MKDGFYRIGAATPEIRPADCEFNRKAVAKLMHFAAEKGVQALVFPELCLTGYTCGDLFNSTQLLNGARAALKTLMEETADLNLLAVVGLPMVRSAALYNCAAVFCKGQLLGIAAKSNLPNHGEFYEARHFSPAPDYLEMEVDGQIVPLGRNLIFRWEERPGFTVGVEICEDLWVAEPVSTQLALSGASIIMNPSASDEVVGKAAFRRQLVLGQSSRLSCAYAYADAGRGESSTDLVFSGHNLIAENGVLLEESRLFDVGLIYTDVDLERLFQERCRSSTWKEECGASEITFSMEDVDMPLCRKIPRSPFVPEEGADLDQRCDSILQMQAEGLRARLAAAHAQSAVIGVSGGLDSTLALLVTTHAFDLLNLPRKNIRAVSMPGFGTTGRTKNNAQLLAEELGADFSEISISASVEMHFKDIGHDPNLRDVTYENAQARERTQVLMDLANQAGGLVVGTGDLSELALGWATYNGDHMSMYAVNSSVPKTLVRHLVAYAARKAGGTLGKVLLDVLDTPVSPELLPPVDGEISQRTEDLVGPYELHDFFLYYMLRFGFGPEKMLHMACIAFPERPEDEIQKWLQVFIKRFFSQQFKRSCMPDGPKIGSVTLSPRGDWRMPSDASAALWLQE